MDTEIILRPVEDGDLPLLGEWLNRERILKWYDDADEWLGGSGSGTGRSLS